MDGVTTVAYVCSSGCEIAKWENLKTLSFYNQQMPLQRVPSQPKNDAYAKKEGTLIIKNILFNLQLL